MANVSRIGSGLVVVAGLFGASGCGGSTVQQPASAAAPAAVESAQAPAGAAPAGEAAPRAAPAAGDGPTTEAVPIAGSEYVRGRSAIVVKAPIARVREAVYDFGHYAEFMPHYRTSKLLGRTASGARDVYMEVEALRGAIRMWAEIEVPKPVVEADGTETIETHFVKGNVKTFEATWRLRKIDDASTQLSLEVFLDPGIALPSGLVNKENMGGSADGVSAMRGHAEQPKQ